LVSAEITFVNSVQFCQKFMRKKNCRRQLEDEHDSGRGGTIHRVNAPGSG
jgi:hypothetical protein